MTGGPLLRTVWPALRRGSGQVQLGTDPAHAVVVDGLDEAEIAALESLDGTRELPAALQTPRARDVLDDLVARGLVVDVRDPVALPPALRSLLAPDAQALVCTASPTDQGYAALVRRRGTHVLVVGRGGLPTAVGSQLRACGVGRLTVGAHAAAAWQHAADVGSEVGSDVVPDLVVLVGAHALETSLATPWRARGIPVLPLVLHGLEAVIGPVIVPGGPCLRCLDLTRTDLDPAWPAVLGQLTRPGVGSGAEVNGETSLVAVAASMTTMVALAVLDGVRLPAGHSLEVGLPWPRVGQRRWQVHPRCGCGTTGPSGRPAEPLASAQARMAG